VVFFYYLGNFLHRRKGDGVLGTKFLAGAATDDAAIRLNNAGTIFLFIPFKNAIFTEIEALPTADTFIFINCGIPGYIFTRNLEHAVPPDS
jgi:hypothetical protein